MLLDDNRDKVIRYLSTMKKMLKHNCKLVILLDRDKNYLFKYLYNLSEKDVRNHLLSIKENEFKEIRYSEHQKHVGEELYIWRIKRDLTSLDGSEVEEDIYIKTHIDEKKNIIIVISFHRYGDV